MKHSRSRSQDFFNAHPVYLSVEKMEGFYHGFCNSTIWPLFHYFPAYASYQEAHWKTYESVNRAFCEAVLHVYRPGDIVIWVHDYHLILLPRLLRQKLPDAPIGFFLHIPFPSYEMLRILPDEKRKALLGGMVGADLVGFHAEDYTDHFFRSVERFLGLERSSNFLSTEAGPVKADTFPMGIDYDSYAAAVESPDAQIEKEQLRRTLGDARVILSIDRLDYTKGILNRLRGYDTLLEENPHWQGKVVMLLVVTPSRVGVQRYEATKQEIESYVSNINGRYGSIDWAPVRYQHKFLPLPALAALYNMSDVALVIPLRDGMNLTAKEYLASRTDGTGVLILSELVGSAEELHDAVIVNPNSNASIVAGLKQALEMPLDEQVRRMGRMQYQLKRTGAASWARNFIQELVKVKRSQQLVDKVQTEGNQANVGESERSGSRSRFIYQDGAFLPVDRQDVVKPAGDPPEQP